MIDTDSRSLEFMINAEDCCDVGEREMRDIVIKVYLDNDIHHRLDLSGEFFEQFVTRRFKNKWDCTNLRTLSRVSSAQYVLTQRNTLTYMEYTMRLTRSIKGTKGMDFDNYAGRILTIDEAHDSTKRSAKKQKQTRFQSKKGNMVMVTIKKFEFAQLNDKRYILSDGISLLLYGHKHLTFVENFKKSLLPLTPIKLIKHQYNLIRFEQGILEQNERMRVMNCVLLQQPIFYKRGTLKRSQFQISENTRDFLLHGFWRKI